MKHSEAFWQRLGGIERLLYTLMMRGRFATWGSKSRLERGAKLESPFLIKVGRAVHICEHAWLNAKDDRGDGQTTLEIGDDTYIGRFVHVNAWREVIIGRKVLIADRVFISDAGHQYLDKEAPVRHQADPFLGPVHLGDGCWIGIGAVILPGVKIGRNAVVAANSVVNMDVPDYAVAAGVPCRIVRQL